MGYNLSQVKAIEAKNKKRLLAVNPKEKDSYAGKRFGRLIALERVEDAVTPKGKRIIRYKCKCDCGNEKIVRKCHLSSGKIISCGCFHKEQIGNARRKHGFSHKERLYSIWLGIKDRCYNPNNNHYKSYGGRGIAVCEEWRNDYVKFRNWCISNGYIEEIRESGRNNITIDRINVNGNYEPVNCRFLTNRENCLNKRDTLTDEERYKICPICGKQFTLRKRNQQKTCSSECGHIIRKLNYKSERSTNGRFKEAII